jgi:hypothetical protein
MFTRRVLPPAQQVSLRAAFPQSRVLSWAATSDGYAVALVDRLALGSSEAWQAVAWHDIVRGAWHPQTQSLSWSDGQGQSHQLTLTDPGDLPQVFRERVDATFVVEERVGPRASGAVVTAQRRLGQRHPDDQLIFRITAVNPDQPLTAQITALAQARLADLRRDLT